MTSRRSIDPAAMLQDSRDMRARAEALAEEQCPCDACSGNGVVYRSRLGNAPCTACDGRGYTTESIDALEQGLRLERRSTLEHSADWCRAAANACADQLVLTSSESKRRDLRAKASIAAGLAIRLRQEAARV